MTPAELKLIAGLLGVELSYLTEVLDTANSDELWTIAGRVIEQMRERGSTVELHNAGDFDRKEECFAQFNLDHAAVCAWTDTLPAAILKAACKAIGAAP